MPIREQIGLGIVPLSDAFLDAIRSAQMMAGGMEHRRMLPETMTSPTMFGPSANEHVVRAVSTLQDVSTPDAHALHLQTIVNQTRPNSLCTPMGCNKLFAGHGVKPVHIPSTRDKLLPFGRSWTLLYLSIHAQTKEQNLRKRHKSF